MFSRVRSLLLSLAVLLVSLCGLRAQSVVSLGTPTGYVDDYASVLSPTAREKLEGLCVEVHNKTRAQIFVVTVKALDGVPLEQFANDLFHTWKVGERKTDRGVLVLFALAEHKYRIEVGYGLEGLLNDAKVGDIGRAMVPELQAGHYDEAARLSTNALAADIADDAHVQVTPVTAFAATAPVATVTPAALDAGRQWGIVFGCVGLLFGLVVALLFWANRKSQQWADRQADAREQAAAMGFAGVKPLRFDPNVPPPTSAARKKRWSSDGSSTPGDSSSSSWSSSDSGSSFSGGDGGDSGGGGASGDW